MTMSTLKIHNPATGALLAELPADDATSIAAKARAARAAQAAWAARPLAERIAIVQRFRDAVIAEREALTKTLTQEVGKPISQSRNELSGLLPRLDFFLAQAASAFADEPVFDEGGMRERIAHVPLGLVANISAWNYPWFVSCNVVVPALLAGNAVLYKPSEFATLTACPSTNVVQDPPQFQWTLHAASPTNPLPYYSGVLEYGQATFTINGETLTTRAYRQAGGTYTLPGPTIRMSPGNKYVLRFHNTLPHTAASTEHNVFKDPDVTNLHTHGVHISGETPGDDVTRFFEGQRGGDYVYDIPADHMGGTYWYHAHHHGSTFLQVSSGAFGQMLIADDNDGVPANVAAMTERQLLVARRLQRS